MLVLSLVYVETALDVLGVYRVCTRISKTNTFLVKPLPLFMIVVTVTHIVCECNTTYVFSALQYRALEIAIINSLVFITIMLRQKMYNETYMCVARAHR